MINFEIWLQRTFLDPNMPKFFAWEEKDESEGVPTHDRWEAMIKAEKPARFFIFYTLPHLFSAKILRRIDDFFYWLKSFVWRKDHLLDLRQPKSKIFEDNYRWGYLDPHYKLIYACFNILVEHVEAANKCEFHYGPNNIKELIKESENKDDGFNYDDMIWGLKEQKELYEYWTVERKQSARYISSARHMWYQNRNDKHGKAYLKHLHDMEELFTKKEEEMLVRLVKIRERLWI